MGALIILALMPVLGNTEVTVKLYEEAIATDDKGAKESILLYLSGLSHGLEWSNAMNKDNPLYCQPGKLALTTSNYVNLLNDEIILHRNYALKDPTYSVDDKPLGLILLRGVMNTFPCD